MNTNLLELLTHPGAFFRALAKLPPSNTRYLWLVLLSGMVTGLYGALAGRATQAALQGVPGLPGGGAATLVIAVVSGFVVTLILWLILWGLGSLGAGKEGRAAEVFGAAFLPSLIVSLVLLPVSAIFPTQITVAPPNFAGLEGAELGRAVQTYSAAVQREVAAQPLSRVSSVLSYAAFAWQFYLAYVGFGVLSADRSRALRGTLIPLGVLLLLGGAFWLLGRALTGLVAG